MYRVIKPMVSSRKRTETRRRRVREKLDDPVESLFAALTVSEKRSALADLGGPPTGQATRDSEAVEKAILESGRSTEDILTILRRYEVGSPKKHFFFCTFTGDVKKAVKSAKQHLGRQLAKNVVLSFVRDDDERAIYFLLERTTHGIVWVELPGQEGYPVVRGKKQTKVRHATICRIDVANGRVMLNYPGLPVGIDYDYAVAISGCMEAIAKLGLHLEPLPVRACISSVISAKGRRVLPVRGDVITPEGSLRLRSLAGKASIQQLIARLVEAGPDKDGGVPDEPEILDRITHNLGQHTFNTIGLLWIEERVLTRVEFNDAGADFLFIWGHTDPSFALADKMIDLFYSLAGCLDSPTFNEIWSAIVDLTKDGVITLGDFRGRFKATADTIDEVITQAVKLGLLIPVFRLKADDDFLEELGRTDWTPNLPELGQIFKDSAGSVVVDGSKPENILVAFRRVRVRGGAT